MPVNTFHPDYVDRKPEWDAMRDTVRGPQAVKKKGSFYLPMPSGFTVQSDGGSALYSAYQTRAQFPNIVRPTVRGMVGVIHRIEAQITLPPQMEPLRRKATKEGLTLSAFARTVTNELLKTGRYGILVDAPIEGADTPLMSGYTAESIINWSEEEQDFYVLDESGLLRRDFDWTNEQKWRVLALTGSVYQQKLFNQSVTEGTVIAPSRRGGGSLNAIPFTIIGATEVMDFVDDPPLMGVADSALAAYRLDADYRHQLYMSGQETLVVSGIDKSEMPTAVGASVVIVLPQGGDASYVGPSGVGIEAHRTAISDELDRAVAEGAKVFDSAGKVAESGEALRLRYGAQTATLTSISKSSAEGLERALRHAAQFIGANPDEVAVKPNLRFIDTSLSPADAEALVRLWQARGISREDMHWNLQRGEIIREDKSFEDYTREIDEGAEIEAANFPDEDMRRQQEEEAARIAAE